MCNISTQTHPEFNKEEGILRALLIKLFKPPFFLRELVVDLPDVHGLEKRVAVRGVGLSNVDKQVFAILQRTETKETQEDEVILKEHLPQNYIRHEERESVALSTELNVILFYIFVVPKGIRKLLHPG